MIEMITRFSSQSVNYIRQDKVNCVLVLIAFLIVNLLSTFLLQDLTPGEFTGSLVSFLFEIYKSFFGVYLLITFYKFYRENHLQKNITENFWNACCATPLYLFYTFVMTLYLILGLFLFVVPLFYFLGKYIFAAPMSVVIENPTKGYMDLSSDLSKGRILEVLGVVFIAEFIPYLLFEPFFWYSFGEFNLTIEMIASILKTPVEIFCILFFYHYLIELLDRVKETESLS